VRIVQLATVTVCLALTAGSLFAHIPKLKPGNRYEAGRTVAESRSTRHVAGREYTSPESGEQHRRILIYDRSSGEFKGFAKTGRLKGDASTRHYFGK
jgi:hypothetical protein